MSTSHKAARTDLASTLTAADPPPTATQPASDGALPMRDPGRYTIYGEHARGGLGKVLKVLDRDLDRTLAVKQLLHTGHRAEARFVREARITARLEHPSIIPVHEAGVWPDGLPFFAMKFVAGSTLREAIRACSTIEQRLALLPNVIAVANAIAYAHSEGIIHRDLKPSNVMIGEYGETVVVDWGLAKELADTSPTESAGPFRTPVEDDVTVEGSIVGTPGYMPPEQGHGREVDERADVYSIGAMLYHVLSGSAPYPEKDSDSVLAALLERAPAPLQTVEPHVAPDLATIVAKAMARNPDDRYRTAAELATDLQRFQTGQLVGVHAYSRGELFMRWLRHHRGSVSVGVIAVVVLAVVGGLSIQRILSERATAEARAAELILQQADSLLATDPTRALAVLKTYPTDATDWTRARDIAADAVSRGVARHVLGGNTGRVIHLAFTGDGKELISSAWDGSIQAWSTDTGVGTTIDKTEAAAAAIATSGDGRWTAYAHPDNSIVLINRQDGSRRQLKGHPKNVWWLSFSADSKTLVSVGYDQTIRLWDPVVGAETNAVTGTLPALAQSGALAYLGLDGMLHVVRVGTGTARSIAPGPPAIQSLFVSPDGHWLAATDRDMSVHVWSADDGEHRLFGTHDGRGSPTFSPDSTALVTASDDTVQLWTLASGQRTAPQRHDGPVHATAFSPDGTLLASAGADGIVHVSELATGAQWRYRGHAAVQSNLAFSHDGQQLASADENGQIRIWRLDPERPRVLRGHDGYTYHAVYSPDGSAIATDSVDGTARLWNVSDSSSIALHGHAGLVFGVAFSPDGETLLTRSADQTARLWNRTGTLRRELRTNAFIAACSFAPDGRSAMTAGGDGNVRIWDVDSDDVKVFAAHTGGIATAEFLPGGDLLTAGEDGVIKRWNLSTGSARLVGDYGQPASTELAVSPDGRSAVSATQDGQVWLWSLVDNTRRLLYQHRGDVADIRYSPNGRYVASSAENDHVRVYDRATKRTTTLTAHDDWVRELAFSPDSRVLATASQDSTARLWSLDSQTATVLRGHVLQPVRGVSFSPDGEHLATASWDGTARIWRNTADKGAPAAPRALLAWLSSATSYDIPSQAKH